MKNFAFTDIENILPADTKIIGDRNEIRFNNIKTIFEADENSLVWVNPTRKDKGAIVANTRAKVIICEKELGIPDHAKIFIEVENPKLVFSRIVDALFGEERIYGIHPSAVIHPEAEIHPESYIGPLNYIGKVTIGKHTVIKGNCHIADKTVIGNNVMIHHNVSIGGDGFGYARNEDGILEKFPHIGGVVIEDNVEIGSNTCVDRGTLGNTLIKEGAKIDNLVHIAHNVIIGRNAAVVALSLIGGSTVIGDNAWIAPSSCLRDAIVIGQNATVGMGAVVTKNIPEGETWTGNPAKVLGEFLTLQKKLKDL